jgi:hypothetical protein
VKFVAFLDVLGFKEMVDNCTHGELDRTYNMFVTSTALALAQGKFVSGTKDGRPVVVPDVNGTSVSCLIASDSIILWTQNLSTKEFVDIISISGDMLATGFITGLPLRGGIAMGELSVGNQTLGSTGSMTVQSIFGRALTNAYRVESTQEWAGCAISQTCIDWYVTESDKHAANPDFATLDYLRSQKIILEYQVPVKGGTARKMWVVNWPQFNRGGIADEAVRRSFKMHKKSANADAIKTKLENTLAYLAFALVQ